VSPGAAALPAQPDEPASKGGVRAGHP
jgi:hypothetical protein